MPSLTLDERFGALLAGDQALMADPFPLYREVRESASVYDLGGTLLVCGHAPMLEVIRSDGRLFVNALGLRGEAAEQARAQLPAEYLEAFDALAGFYSLTLPERSREDHRRLRSIVHRSFTPRRMAQLTGSIKRYVADLLSHVAEQDEPDLTYVSDRLPLMVMSDLLGIPPDDLGRMQSSVAKLAATRSADAPPNVLLIAHEGLNELLDYGTELIEAYRPGSDAADVVACLVEAERENQVTRDEFVAMLVFLLGSGHETTANLLSAGSIALLGEREQWQILADDPDAMADAATEELLRFVTPVQFVSRIALADGAVGDTPFREGQQLLLVTAAANRDPQAFAAPDVLDLTRPDVGAHLALGFGVHFCLGASLLRIEGREYFSELARRFPALELASDAFEWTGHIQTRRPAAVPVRI